MWRVGSTAQAEFTAKRNNESQRKCHRGCRKIAECLISLGTDAEIRFTRTLAYRIHGFRGTSRSTASILRFSTGLGMRSDLQQTTPERDHDCMGPIVGL